MNISPSTAVRDLGVILDNTLSLDKYVSAIVKSCFFQLRQLKTVRKALSKSHVKTLLHAFITSRVDYCNSLLVGLPLYQLDRLQLVLNAAARLYANASSRAHVTGILRDDLHWLRITERISYKLCILTYQCLHNCAPMYLSNYCVRLLDSSSRLSRNRSAATGNLCTPRCKTKTYGPRSFRVSGPNSWNALPAELKQDMPYPSN